MKYAVMFPGQGSQSLGMLGDLQDALVQQTWIEASDALGWDVAQLIAGGPQDKLDRTEFTQPALLAAGVAVWRIWQSRCEQPPAWLCGHSLGEYSALVAAGSLEFGAALKLVQLRGQLMQNAVPEGSGGMAAVLGMDAESLAALCEQCDQGVLEPVNFNAPGQIVVAGASAALAWLEAEGKAAGAKLVKRLPVSVPSHCSLMQGAAEKLGEALDQVAVSAPTIPVLHNLDATSREQPDQIRMALRQQLYQPVQWTETLNALVSGGCGLLLECGPGGVLCGLAKRGARGVPAVPLGSDAGLQQALEQFNNGDSA